MTSEKRKREISMHILRVRCANSCFSYLVDITAVEDVMEIQEAELIKTGWLLF